MALEEKASYLEEKGPATEPEENVWQTFLQQSGNSERRSIEGQVIFLGDPNCGKTSLVSMMGKLEQTAGEMKRFLMMRYAYIHLTDAESDTKKSVLNVWQISQPSHAKLLEVVVKPKQMRYLAFVICLDLSKPHTVKDQFEKWIGVAREAQEEMLNRLDPSEAEELRNRVSHTIQYYVNPKEAAEVTTELDEEEKADIPLQTEVPGVNLGCPIIVVGTKSDMFRTNYQSDADANDRYDVLMLYIRKWALDYGAAIFNMGKGTKDQAARILQYLDDRLFDTTFNRGPNAVIQLSNMLIKGPGRQEAFLFIPSGYDTASIIDTQAGENRELSEEFYHSCFQPPKAKATRAGRRMGRTMRSWDDQELLEDLKWELYKSRAFHAYTQIRDKKKSAGEPWPEGEEYKPDPETNWQEAWWNVYQDRLNPEFNNPETREQYKKQDKKYRLQGKKADPTGGGKFVGMLMGAVTHAQQSRVKKS